MIEQDYALVADVGCTGVRMAHSCSEQTSPGAVGRRLNEENR